VSTFDPQAIIDTVVSHAQRLGVFDQVNAHEPDSPPGSGVTAAVWADYLGPATGLSGLKATQGLFVVKVRSYCSMLQEPEDLIDPALLRASWQLMAAISADIDLGIVDDDGDEDAWVDLLGMSRLRLETLAGYLQQGDVTYRVMTTSVPIIINNLWPQGQGA
jgi:hypothetical protein